MTPTSYQIVNGLLTAVGVLLALHGLYFFVVALFGLRKPKQAPQTAANTRFAVVVAARNEQAVIGNLVDSLVAQRYPKDKYTVFVAPNNCTDYTREVALQHGAHIFETAGPIAGKGEVLTQAVDSILSGGLYDAVCVFDADNVVHPDFLQKMNDAYQNGATVAQGTRDSKNPTASAVSCSYSVCYWMLNRFYNAARHWLGLSALIGGSGFMVSCQMLRTLGGWHTETMTEDYEFSAQCVLAGERVHYVPGAVIYDEQPLTFRQSWRQRRRWSTGSAQGMELYLRKLARSGVKNRRMVCLDMALTFLTPAMGLASPLVGLLSGAALLAGVLTWQWIPVVQLLLVALAAAALAFVACAALAAVMVVLNRGRLQKGAGKGVAYFALFLLSWMPIGIISLFHRQTVWHPIAHTCNMDAKDLAA